MNDLYSQWEKDEKAPFSGWDFSYIAHRKISGNLSWNYEKEAKKLIKKANAVLDIGTGGGERLLTLGPFPKHTFATENWPPNISLARRRLAPFGIKVRVDQKGKLPFKNEEFDLVINRHSFFKEREVYRVLQDRGVFFTQQVGGDNLEDLAKAFSVKEKYSNKKRTLKLLVNNLKRTGFKIKKAKQWVGKIEFKDVGAIVYTLKAIPWIVEGFSVDKYLSILENFQERLNKRQRLVFKTTRFLIKVQK